MLSDTSARPWLSKYPEGVPADVDTSAYHSLVDLLDSNFQKYSDRTCVSFLGKAISYQTIDHASIALATYFQGLIADCLTQKTHAGAITVFLEIAVKQIDQ